MSARRSAIVIGTATAVAVVVGALALIDSTSESPTPKQERAVPTTQPPVPRTQSAQELEALQRFQEERQKAIDAQRAVAAQIQVELDAIPKG